MRLKKVRVCFFYCTKLCELACTLAFLSHKDYFEDSSVSLPTNMIQTIKTQIESTTTMDDVLSFAPLLFNLEEMKQVLTNQLEKCSKHETDRVNRAYYNGLPLDMIFPSDIIISIVKYLNSAHFECLPLVSRNFKSIIYNNIHIFNRVK